MSKDGRKMVLEVLEELGKWIEGLERTSLGDCITLIIMLCILFSLIIKNIYSTYIEQVLMNAKERRKVFFFRMLVFILFFSIINFVAVTDKIVMIGGVIVSIIGLMFYFFNARKENAVREDLYKNKADREHYKGLDEYYNENKTVALLIVIMGSVPEWIFLIEGMINKFWIGDILILSTIEVCVILLCIPDIWNQKSNVYFYLENEKMFAYKRIEDSILCGNSPDINKAKKYINIEYAKFKKKEIVHKRYNDMGWKEKRELAKEYNGRKKLELKK